MIVLPLVLPLLVFTALYHVLRRFTNRSKSESAPQRLPGPKGLPWIGPVNKLPRRGAYFALKKWSDEYGPIFEVTLLGQRTLVLGNEEQSRLLLAQKSAIYSGRPPVNSLVDSQSKTGRGIYMALMSRNDDWARQRKAWIMVANAAKADGSIANAIELETGNFLLDLLAMANRPCTDWSAAAELMTARVAGRVTFGDPTLASRIRHETFLWQKHISPGGFLPNLAWPLAKIPHFLSPWKIQEKKREDVQQALWQSCVDRVGHCVGRGHAVAPSYAKTYLESLTRKEKGESKTSVASLVPKPAHAAAFLGMAAVFNNLTIAQPLINFIRCLATYPEHQSRILAELDQLAHSDLPQASDLPSLPYLRAVMLETVRFRPPIPTGIPHELESDDIIDGVLFRAGTPVLAPSYTISRDRYLYPSPHKFLPERWIDPTFPTCQSDGKLPSLGSVGGNFGFGKRFCIGVELTEMETYLAAARTVWAFQWTLTEAGQAEVQSDLAEGEERGGMRWPREMKEALTVGKTGTCEVLFRPRDGRDITQAVETLKASVGDVCAGLESRSG